MERGFYSLDSDGGEEQQPERNDMGAENHPQPPPQNITIVAPDAPVGAVKFDGGKAPIYQGFLNRFPRAIQGIAMVSEYGFRKYGTYDGWEKVPDGLNRYTDAKARHENLQSIEGPYDVRDSGLPHALQEAWNAMARAELLLQAGTIVVTRGNEIKDGKPVLETARPA